MAQPFRIGIAGLGTVGAGVVKIMQTHGDLLAARAGRPVEIVCVSARDKNRDRGVDLSGYRWVENVSDMAVDDECDAVVELIGGADGAAYDLVKTALEKGRPVVTANKALLAQHGLELAFLAEESGAALAYEAAVAGGIPIIKSLREGFAGNEIEAVFGILNGTCNYILTEMRETGREFEEVLKEAQGKGYAEADPTFDVDGIDAGHKLCLLTSLAFGVKPDFASLRMTGIRQINSTDIAFARELGYHIKLLGIARRIDGKIVQILEPALVQIESQLGRIEGVYNAVLVEGDAVDTALSVGRGAGQGPTASAVMADIIDLARGLRVPTFGIPARELKDSKWIDPGAMESCYYLRLNVLDKPGVLAEVAGILRDRNVSIEAFIQRGRDPGQPVPLVLTTHEVRHADMVRACAEIAVLPVSIEKPCLIRIEEL